MEEAEWHRRQGMEVDSMLGAEDAGLDVWDQKVRGEKAIQKNRWESKSKRSILVQWRRET